MPKKSQRRASAKRRDSEISPLDPIDLSLLTKLRENGRATIQVLAQAVGVSAATASVRVQRLFDRGYAKGVHARIDHSRLGYSLCAYVLLLVNDITGDRGRLTERFLQLPEVEEVAWVTGEHDLIIKLWATDTRHLEAIVVELDEIGARSRTLIVLGEPHQKTGVEFERPHTTLDHRQPAR